MNTMNDLSGISVDMLLLRVLLLNLKLGSYL